MGTSLTNTGGDNLKYQIINRFFTVLVACLPFLYQYKSFVGTISLGEMLLIPFLVLYLLNDIQNSKFPFKIYDGYPIYIVIILLSMVVCSIQPHFSFLKFSTIFVRMMYYSVLIFVSYKRLDIKFGLRVLVIITTCFSIYSLLQFIAQKLYSVYLPTVLNTGWVFEPEANDRINYSIYYRYLYRPSSLFLEPSYYALFSGIGLSASIFGDNETKKSLIPSLIITLGLVVSGASTALGLIIINWTVYFVDLYFVKKRKISLRILVLTMSVIAFIFLVFSSSLSTILLERTLSGGSFNQRVGRGFTLIENMTLFQHVFGVGINNIDNFVISRAISTAYDETNLNTVSSFLGTYICSGIISMVFYLKMFYNMYFNRRNTTLSKVLVLSLLFLCLIEVTSFSYRFAFYFVFIIGIQKLNLVQEGDKV